MKDVVDSCLFEHDSRTAIYWLFEHDSRTAIYWQ